MTADIQGAQPLETQDSRPGQAAVLAFNRPQPTGQGFGQNTSSDRFTHGLADPFDIIDDRLQ
jgi:hypothetical protein